jgi:hypothetical protein
MSRALFDNFGQEVNIRVRQGILAALNESSDVRFPLPEASAAILSELAQSDPLYFDPYLVDQVISSLELAGFRRAGARAFAPVLLEIAQASGVSVFEYFDLNANTVKFVSDTIEAINQYRPAGSRLGVTVPDRNRRNRFRAQVQP